MDSFLSQKIHEMIYIAICIKNEQIKYYNDSLKCLLRSGNK
jgi:hypothetical protein